MTAVYIWPACLIGESVYTSPWRVRRTLQWDGAPGQKVETTQRAVVEFGGEVVRENAPDLDIAIDRLRGGINLVGVFNPEMRLQAGFDGEMARSGATEYWRANGKTSTWTGTPDGNWRVVSISATGSAGATSVSISGLLSGEAVPKGMMIRAGDYRYFVAEDAAAGASTLTLATPLVEATTAADLPGDYFVGQLLGQPEVSRADKDGRRTYAVRLAEVYSDEVDGGFTYS